MEATSSWLFLGIKELLILFFYMLFHRDIYQPRPIIVIIRVHISAYFSATLQDHLNTTQKTKHQDLLLNKNLISKDSAFKGQIKSKSRLAPHGAP